MRQIFLLILLAALVFASCSEIASPQTPSLEPETPGAASRPRAPTLTSPPLTSTPTGLLPTPTSTRQPAAATAPPSPVPSLPHDRLLIAYQSRSPEPRLILLDPSDDSSFEFDFPPGAIFATPFLDGLSPDARHFVFYEGGTEGEYGELNAEPPNFGMRVFNLDSREVIFSTPLLSSEFPEVLKPIVEMTEDEYWMVEPDREAKLKDMYETMQATVLNYLRTAAWSPDGNLLAFASQNPGPTSDLFFFDPVAAEARLVTGEPGHVLKLTWAPDSSAIALETTLYDRHARRVTTDLLSRAGALLGSIEHTYFHGWHSPTTVLLHREVDFRDPFFDLSALSVIDNSLTTLWEGSFDDFAVSPDLSSVLINSSQPNAPDQAPGLHLKMRDADTTLHLSEAVFWKVTYWGSERFAFAASAPHTGIFDVPQEGGTYGISPTGEVTPIDDGDGYLLPSPDRNFLATYGPYDFLAGLRVFGGDGELLATLSDARITCLRWNAASTHLAYQVEDRLYVWEAGDESARMVADRLEDQLDYRECAFRWVNDRP